ncbi:MAG: serine/threonine protein kinase [Candidatus Obscuribacterales bacterium]|nr:serine/threonine protein kinase [Candidatus Obscuribacterales bacterium]
MAELELSVRYKTLPTRVGFGVMCVSMPFWSLLAPILLGLFVGHVYRNPELAYSWATFVICFGLLAINLMGLLLTALSEDDKLYVSKDGIAFPLFMLPNMRFRRNRSWSELKNADLIQTSATDHGHLLLTFDGASVSVNLNCIDASDREQLLLAVELWGVDCVRAPALVDYQSKLQNEIRGISQLSYTQMWEEELSRRFNATSFVPLEPDAKLRGGKLVISKQLAFGGLSALYLAQMNKLDTVVVKEAVIPQNAEDESRQRAEERIQREAQFLMRLEHDNIAKVRDHFVEEGRHYLLLDYVHGQDLRQYVKQNGPQSEETVLSWAMQIADIVRYLHSQEPPIVHRDLTPDNLVLRNDGAVTLIDFGAANEFIGQATGTLVGKQAYMSPEQLRGKATTQSDLYSLGCTLFYLLVGRDPTPLSTSRPKGALPAVSAELDAIVALLTEFEPEDRIQSADNLIDKLVELPDSKPENSSPVGANQS